MDTVGGRVNRKDCSHRPALRCLRGYQRKRKCPLKATLSMRKESSRWPFYCGAPSDEVSNRKNPGLCDLFLVAPLACEQSVRGIRLARLAPIPVVAKPHFPTTLKTCYPNRCVWLMLFAVYKYSSRKRHLS